MSEQRKARFAAFVAGALAVASAVMDDDMAWAACFVAWAIFESATLIIGAIDRRER